MKNMEINKVFSFNSADAKEYGINGAVILYNIRFWLDKNKANAKNIHDGYVWTYNSAKAFKELFPFLSQKQISNTLKKLEDAGVLLTGNYNQSTYDRTKWYTVKREYCILQNGKMENPEKENGFYQNGQPIPDIKPNSKPNIKQREENFKKLLLPFLKEKEIGKDELENFFRYWTEHGPKDRKMRFEKETSFDISRRIDTWIANKKRWEKEKNSAKKEKNKIDFDTLERLGSSNLNEKIG